MSIIAGRRRVPRGYSKSGQVIRALNKTHSRVSFPATRLRRLRRTEPLRDLVGSTVTVDHSVQLSVRLPAHRLLPTALVATESQLVVTPVCSARTLADGRPPMGIACAQQDLSRVYPLADDPERCVEDFLELAAAHALALAEQLEHQEASVQRFMELSDS